METDPGLVPRGAVESNWWPCWESGVPIVINLNHIRRLEPTDDTTWMVTWVDGTVTWVSAVDPAHGDQD